MKKAGFASNHNQNPFPLATKGVDHDSNGDDARHTTAEVQDNEKPSSSPTGPSDLFIQIMDGDIDPKCIS